MPTLIDINLRFFKVLMSADTTKPRTAGLCSACLYQRIKTLLPSLIFHQILVPQAMLAKVAFHAI